MPSPTSTSMSAAPGASLSALNLATAAGGYRPEGGAPADRAVRGVWDHCAGHAGEVETALVSSRVRAAGTTVGPFRLERALGGGRDTEVWRANGDGIIVALKLLRPGADALARA